MTNRIGRVVGSLMAVLLVGSCRDITGPDDELARARVLWAMNRPANYSYRIARDCECLPDYAGPVIVTVRNHVVASLRYVGFGAPLAPLSEQYCPPIAGLFDAIESALSSREKGARVSPQFDAALGYPVYALVGHPRIADAAFVQFVSEFRLD